MSYSPTSRLQAALDNILRALNKLSFLAALQTPASELRVNINSGTLPVVTTVSTVTVVASITSVANQVNAGGYALSHQVMAMMNQSVAMGIRSNITVS